MEINCKYEHRPLKNVNSSKQLLIHVQNQQTLNDISIHLEPYVTNIYTLSSSQASFVAGLRLCAVS